MRRLGAHSDIGFIAYWTQSSGIYPGMSIALISNALNCRFSNSDGSFLSSGLTVPLDGAWHHLAISYTSGTIYWAVDGVIATTVRTLVSSGTAPNTLYFGGNGSTRFCNAVLDEMRFSDVARYTTNFSPKRYPDSGMGTADPTTAVACAPGLLTVTLSEALPTGTSLKAKLLSTTGGDTGFQVLTGSGTSYAYDFTGAAVGSWYPQVQLFAGGALNVNTPTVTQAVLDWTLPVFPRRGGTIARFGPSLVRWCLP